MDDKDKKGWVDGTWYGGSEDKEQPESKRNSQNTISISSIITWVVVLSLLSSIIFIMYFLYSTFFYESNYEKCIKESNRSPAAKSICRGLHG
tara:strand:- start:70 stop:345 length:276 start_codon:yes stop_codon:yes gene_type:complete